MTAADKGAAVRRLAADYLYQPPPVPQFDRELKRKESAEDVSIKQYGAVKAQDQLKREQSPTDNENLAADDDMSLPGTATFDGIFSQVSKGKRRRRRFKIERRKEVAKIRIHGACLECRFRKVAVC